MDVRLVVVRPFGPRAKGDVLSSPSDVMKILSSENICNVVRIGVLPTSGEDIKPSSTTGDKAEGS